jgi:hypothetical protein
MNALVQLEPGALGEPLAPEIERARRYVAAAQAPATERAYRIGWDDFSAWCAFRRAEPLPAHPAAVAMYLSFLADRGLSAASIGQRAAAIAHRHRKAGHEAPRSPPRSSSSIRSSAPVRRSSAYSFGPGSAPFYTLAATPSWEGCAMSNFEFFYLVVGPIAMLSIGAVLFFGGRWLIELADRKTHRPAE